MKLKLFIVCSIAVLIAASCGNSTNNIEYVNIDSELLKSEAENYAGQKVAVEGEIIHVCGVDGKKMKLRTSLNQIIKIVYKDSLAVFDPALKGKAGTIKGTLTTSKIEKEFIDEVAKKKTLLCHIDNSPCKDEEWIQRKKKEGVAEAMADRSVVTLRKEMKKTGKDYISIITICADRMEFQETE